jgi:23S rRNA (cytidine1920-2'-O)/16S rRNA (cytidine1409-2'-O)-methyltransferase
MAGSKPRLDDLLVARGLATDVAKARALIMAGVVYAGDRRLPSPGERFLDTADLSVRKPEHPWVSRGGLKLVRGLDHFGINPSGLTCLDIGASTGGFSDVLLVRGARRVYAVDVGYGQLAQKVRDDPRVVVLERTNARALNAASVPDPVDLIVCDASFIGLRTVLPAPMARAAPGARLIALIKPQFEADKSEVGPKGVVRDSAVHGRVCAEIAAWLGAQPGWRVLGVTPSPIAGPEGNLEFLIGAVFS